MERRRRELERKQEEDGKGRLKGKSGGGVARSSRRFKNSTCLAGTLHPAALLCKTPHQAECGVYWASSPEHVPRQPRLSLTAASLQHPGQHLASIATHYLSELIKKGERISLEGGKVGKVFVVVV